MERRVNTNELIADRNIPNEYTRLEHLRKRVLNAIELMPRILRYCLLMRYYQELDDPEIAACLDTTVGTAKRLDSLAVEMLYELLAVEKQVNPAIWNEGQMIPLGSALNVIFECDATATVSEASIHRCLLAVGARKSIEK